MGVLNHQETPTACPTVYPFTEAESRQAAQEWGCNCGPNALAFALQVKLDVVRPAIPGFESKRYTSPSMMKQALAGLGSPYVDIPASRQEMFSVITALVRVQWTGPWTEPGMNPRWAYMHTHWITTFKGRSDEALLFDCNGGVRSFESWETEIVPILTNYPRAYGGWEPTHIWRLRPAERKP